NHGERTLDGLRDNVFSHRKDCYHTSGFSIPIKTLFRKSFTRRGPLQVFVINAKNLLPSFVENCRLYIRHSCCIGITFSRYIQISRLSFTYHLQQLGSCCSASTVNVNNMQWSPSNRRG